MEQLWQDTVGNVTTIGLTENLQEEAGDISFVDIARLGVIQADDTILNIEASKAAIEIPSPISGKIIERNELAEQDPSLLNLADRNKNWIVKIQA